MAGRIFSINTVFQAQDRLSAVATRIAASVTRVGTSAHSASQRLTQGLTRSQQSMNTTLTASQRLALGMSQAGNATQQAGQQAGNAANQVNRLRLAFRFQNAVGHVRDLYRALGNVASRLRSIAGFVMPSGLTSMIGAGALGYGAAKMVSNSDQMEQIETRTIGLLMSNKNFSKITDKAAEAKKINQRIMKFADTQVGEYGDWASLENLFLARGAQPSDRMLSAFGNLAAIHKGGMSGMLETFQSGSRGEVAALDQVPGLQGRTHKGAVTLYFNGESFELGQKTGKDYFKNYNNALLHISEKYFGQLGKLQGQTWDAKWSTLVSSVKVAFDGMLRNTSWWDSLKAGLDSVTISVKNLTPKFTELSQTIYDKLIGSGAFGGAGKTLFDAINGTLDRLINSIKSVSNADINGTVTNLMKLPSLMIDLGSALVNLLPSLSKVINFLANPLKVMNESYAQDMAAKARANGGQLSMSDKLNIDVFSSLRPGSDSPAAVMKRVYEINNERYLNSLRDAETERHNQQAQVDFRKRYNFSSGELFPAKQVTPQIGATSRPLSDISLNTRSTDTISAVQNKLTPWFKATDDNGKSVADLSQTNSDLKTKMDNINTTATDQLAILRNTSEKFDVQAAILREVTSAVREGFAGLNINITNNIKAAASANNSMQTTNTTNVTTSTPAPNVGKTTTGTAARVGK